MTSNVVVQSQPGVSDLAFPVEFAKAVSRMHGKASESLANSIVFHSADVAKKWPKGCKVLIRIEAYHSGTVAYGVDNYWTIDRAKNSLPLVAFFSYAMIEDAWHPQQ